MNFLDDISNGFGSFVTNVVNPGDVFGRITGTRRQADAAQSAADAQAKIAQQQLEEQRSEFKTQLDFATQARADQKAARERALGIAGESPEELAQMGINIELQNQAMTRQMAALDRDQAMLDAVDPAVKEAGKQALDLLQGKQAAALQPVLDQRTRARSQLEQSLRDRLGSDYAQSSAGAAALRNFDNDTSQLTNSVQQQTLGTLLGVAQNTSLSLNPVNNVGTAFSTLGSLNAYGMQAAQNIVGRQVNAFTGNPVNQQLNFNPVNYSMGYNAAGNSTIGGVLQGQGQQALFNTGAGLFGQYLGAKTLGSSLARGSSGYGAGAEAYFS